MTKFSCFYLDKSIVSNPTHCKSVNCYRRTILAGTPDEDCSGYNKLNTSPKLSNLSEERTSLNVKLSHGDVPSEDGAFPDDETFPGDVTTSAKLTRRHFTSSQSDIENCGANFEETDYYRTSSRVRF
jgi:hypothetical protein